MNRLIRCPLRPAFFLAQLIVMLTPHWQGITTPIVVFGTDYTKQSEHHVSHGPDFALSQQVGDGGTELPNAELVVTYVRMIPGSFLLTCVVVYPHVVESKVQRDCV